MIYFILWYITGVMSFLYWHGKHYKLSWNIFPYAVAFGWFGPVTFYLMWNIFKDK